MDARYGREVIPAKISVEKIEVHFAKVGGALFLQRCFEKMGVRFLERCIFRDVHFQRGAFCRVVQSTPPMRQSRDLVT